VQLPGNVFDAGVPTAPAYVTGKASSIAGIIRQEVQPLLLDGAAVPAEDATQLQFQVDAVGTR